MKKGIRKLKRKKTYNTSINRKRLRNKLRKLPNIPCEEIKKAWESVKSIRVNLKEMGLAYDANKAVQNSNEMLEESDIVKEETSSDYAAKASLKVKDYIMRTLEAEAKVPRERLLRLPKGQTQFLTYLIKKYDEDYEAMSRDKKNYDQLTWKQIRAKIKLFKGIPEQYNKCLQDSDV